jgi:hypothetical protein
LHGRRSGVSRRTYQAHGQVSFASHDYSHDADCSSTIAAG